MGELIMAILFFIMGIVYVLGAGKFPKMEGMIISSGTFPRAVAILLLIYSGILIIKNIKNLKVEKNLPKIKKETIIAMLGFIVFYFIFDYVGYIISSILLLVLLSMLLQDKKYKLLDTVILPISFVLALYFIFKLLKVYLPLGSLFN